MWLHIQVYPRTRGETAAGYPVQMYLEGLSPHTRGNRNSGEKSRFEVGSIPAHAGKPYRGPTYWSRCRVYPRTRGETAAGYPVQIYLEGLSPHTRGNRKRTAHSGGELWSIPAHAGKPHRLMHLVGRGGSIPAHAGKPALNGGIRSLIAVYPRTRGETCFSSCTRETIWGLSPHTRGNLPRMPSARRSPGSIPAHAGKPTPNRVTASPSPVYPRTRGETP